MKNLLEYVTLMLVGNLGKQIKKEPEVEQQVRDTIESGIGLALPSKVTPEASSAERLEKTEQQTRRQQKE